MMDGAEAEPQFGQIDPNRGRFLFSASASTSRYKHISCHTVGHAQKILQENPKGLKNIRLKIYDGAFYSSRLIRRCKETYDFPYDLYDLSYALRFSVSEAQPHPLAATHPCLTPAQSSRQFGRLLGFYLSIHFDLIDIHPRGHRLAHLVAAIPHKPMATRPQRPLPHLTHPTT